jgi:methylthioribose-1-phosphate isomerase
VTHAGPGEGLPPTLAWSGDASTGVLELIDQTRLPGELVILECRDVPTAWEAIRSLRVRGAPAIGIAAAYAAVLGARSQGIADAAALRRALAGASAHLRTSRPTAVNLFWALDRMERRAASLPDAQASVLLDALLAEAQAIHEEDRRMCRAIGQYGSDLLNSGQGILTHCNAGGLATSDYGTALAVLFSAHERGKALRVYVDETRPLLQGARLTAWELVARGIPATLICDNMAAQVMKEGRVEVVIVGADRIAANGDTANKIGTYGVAILARAHGVPFYVAAPSSTFDLSIPNGASIPIEQRDPAEITESFGLRTAPAGIDVYNPAFDVTPADLIAGIITEKGIIRPVDTEHVRAVVSAG